MTSSKTSSKQTLAWSRLITDAKLAPRWDGPSDPPISSVVEDSREVKSGSCFVAVQGGKVDGHDFIDKALAGGAAAVVCQRPVVVPPNVTLLVVDSTKGLAGRLAAVLCGLHRVQHDGRLKVAGITGTNGKSTFCYLLRAILRQAGHPTQLCRR